MLVLSRKEHESLFIADYQVMVVEIRGDKVRLGITAPSDVPVHREEVYRAIQRRCKAEAIADQQLQSDQGKDGVS